MNTLIVLTVIGVAGLFSEIFRVKKIILPLVYAGLLIAIAVSVMDWNTNVHYYHEMMVADNYSIAFSVVLIASAFLWFIISPGFFSDRTNESDHFSLIIFALAGGVLMTSFNNMLMLFIGIEILSVSMYILAGSLKRSLASNEAALKYFLMGAFATGFLLFGIALVYGSTGSFNLEIIAQKIAAHPENSSMLNAGILMIMFALAFKVSAVPFHFWAPDVYQGSPTVITAYMSTVVKTAALAAFFRLFIHTFSTVTTAWHSSLMIISALTILTGNIIAVYQTNVKRMLAYSSIAHAGYMIIAILSLNAAASSGLLFYSIAYCLASLSSFAVLLTVNSSMGNESIEAFSGLAKKNPFLAIVMIISMLSLAGIPPAAGFFGKYYIFAFAMTNHLTPLVLTAIVGTLIGVYYYFRVIVTMFRDGSKQVIHVSGGIRIVLLITGILTLLLGIFPGLIAGRL